MYKSVSMGSSEINQLTTSTHRYNPTGKEVCVNE